MANDLSASFPKYWSRRMQRKHHKVDVYRAIANYEEEGTLKIGNIVDRPYRSALTVNTLGSEGSYTRQDIDDTSETLTVDQKKEVTIYVQEPDVIQSKYSQANEYADDAAVALSNWIDGDVLGEYDQASSVVGAYEVAGTGSASDGIGATITISNVLKVFVLASKKLGLLNVKHKAVYKNKQGTQANEKSNLFAVMSPDFWAVLLQFVGGKETVFGDKSAVNGHLGRYMGFDLYESNNLGWSGRLEYGTLGTDGDTIVINGVTLTLKDAIGTTAGNVHLGASTSAVSLDILVAAINAPGTTVAEGAAAGFVALSAANQALLKGITATDGGTYMTLKSKGRGAVIVSETLTAEADIWTPDKQIEHQLFGVKGATDIVIQKYPNLKIKDRTGYLGSDFVTWTLYGKKTFDEGDDCLVDIQSRSDSY